jgi:hypothetical protein
VIRAGAPSLWTNRHALSALAAQTRAMLLDNVTTEGGGFSPALELGGGAGSFRAAGATGARS